VIACRKCGCTENDPCVLDVQGFPFTKGELEAMSDDDLEEQTSGSCCYWVEPDLCSACVERAPAPLLFDHAGRPLRGAP
jgi:hypothetical protein